MMEEKLPEGWVSTKLGSVVFQGDTRHPGGSTEPDFLYVDIEALDNNTQEIVAPKKIRSSEAPGRARLVIRTGDVIFSLTRPYLRNIAIVPSELDNQVASTAYCVMRPEIGVSSRFIFYLVNRDDFIKSIPTYGDSPPAAHDEEFLAMDIPLASTNEQRRIVEAIEQQFSRLDNAIASLESAKARTKQYRASLLKSAVEGELTKDWRDEHPTSETGAKLLERILVERRALWEEEHLAKMREDGITPKNDLWKQRYKEPQEPNVEDLPDLPEDWCWATVEQLSDERRAVTYGVIKLGEPVSRGIPTLRSSNVRHLRFDLKSLKSIAPDIASKYVRTFLQGGEILVTVRGTLGGVAVAPLDFAGYNISREVAMISCVLPSIATCLAFFIGSSPIQNWITQNTKGIAYTGINIETLKSMPLPLPPLNEQVQIVSEIEASLSNIVKLEEATENNLERAEYDRQSILQEAFAGRLVPQDPNDEPASVLLEHIREERKRREEAEKVERTRRKGSDVEIVRRRRTRKNGTGEQVAGLYEKLVEVGTPLAPEELFRQVGLQMDEQSESVEVFYAELHTDENVLIGEMRPDEESVLLEALEPPDGVFLDVEEEEPDVEHEEESEAQMNDEQTLVDAQELFTDETADDEESSVQIQQLEQSEEIPKQTMLWEE